MAEHSDYQKKLIQRYYDNRENIDTTRLSELVANLYLSEGKKRDKLWVKAEELMNRLGVPASRIQHVIAQKDAALLAEVVKDLESGLI